MTKQERIEKQKQRLAEMKEPEAALHHEGYRYIAGVDEVADTADRLYIGSAAYDPEHWYRMKYHFPVIDDDNYDRFAALVLSDMNAGPLHDAAVNEGDTLVVGEPDPLKMTPEQRRNQTVTAVHYPMGGVN